jgi:acetyl esterase/lipase
MDLDWQLPPTRTSGYPAPADLAARRGGMASMVGPPPPIAGVTVGDESLGGVPCVICQPDCPIASLLYFHGGGYRLGSARYSAAFGSRLAAASGARVVVVEYRLAPEEPFPAALHDAAATYGALVDQGTSDIVVVGDSAGGELAPPSSSPPGRLPARQRACCCWPLAGPHRDL